MNERAFIPETESIYWEKEFKYLGTCFKPENHEKYRSLQELDIDELPEAWRDEKVLDDFKLISRRIVHLTVVKLSPSRNSRNSSHTGTGFLTFDPTYGAVIHTSKHVVFDPFEAERTIVHLFYDGEKDKTLQIATEKAKLRDLILNTDDHYKFAEDPGNSTKGLFLSRGSKRGFRSVMCSDYTAFTCEMPLHELFSDEELEFSKKSFSWHMSGLRRILLAPQTDLDVAVISHPHGWTKVISFGKMTRLGGIQPSLYTTPTCSGSSGAPVIRLCADSGHYLSVGQFVHHGHNRAILNMGMGTVRPPITFPYWKPLDTEYGLASGIALLYEPIFYWTLFACDLLHVSTTLNSILDVFAYFSSLSAFAFSGQSWPFFILFTCFWMHIAITTTLGAWRSGFHFALCNLIKLLISMSAFLIGWCMLFLMPWPMNNMFIVSAVWAIVMYTERHFYLSARFSNRMIGGFTEYVQYRLVTELGMKSRKSKKSDLDTTEFTGSRSE